MDRRTFLKALAGAGASLAIPVSLDAATPDQIDAAWETLVGNPWFFSVNEYGTLVEPDVQEPKHRADVYDCDADPKSIEALTGEIETCGPLADEFNSHANDVLDELLNQRENLEELAGAASGRNAKKRLRALDRQIAQLNGYEPWRGWLSMEGEAGLPRFRQIIERWLASTINWNEMEYFPKGWSGQGRAMSFFENMDRETRDALGVVIVEGDCPGSSYFAAELKIPIDDANQAAERLALPFRFRLEA